MACETFNRRIGKHDVATQQFPARQALRLQIRLVNQVGPTLGAGLRELGNASAGSILEADGLQAIAAVIERLAGDLQPDEFLSLVKELLTFTFVDAKKLTDNEFDVVFAGNLGTLYMILAFVIEVNFKDFFEKLAELTGGLKGQFQPFRQSLEERSTNDEKQNKSGSPKA